MPSSANWSRAVGIWTNFLDPKPPAPDQVHFRLGTAEAPERLIVRKPERGPRSTASARRGQVQYSRSGNDLPVVEGDGRWRMEPFLAWIEGLRRWMKDPRATSSWEPLELVPSLQNRAARVILDTVSSTFQRAVHATEQPAGLVPAAPDDGPSGKAELTDQDPYRLLPCRQRLAGFSGSVLLRLGSNGELAEKHDDDPLTLELHYRLSQRDDQTELELDVRPPDLLIGGELHREFLRAFEEKAVEARLHLRLGLNNEAALRAFFRNGTAEAVVMRIRRGRDTDDDLLVLPEDIAGIRLVTMFQAEVAVTRDPSRPNRHRVRLTSRPRLLQPRSQAEDPEELPDQVVERFFRLMAALKNWGGLWP